MAKLINHIPRRVTNRVVRPGQMITKKGHAGDAPDLPVLVTRPDVTPTTGEPGQLLTVTPGVWTNADSVDRQWRRNGVLLPGETALTHTASLPGNYDVREVATNADGSRIATSNVAVIAVAIPEIVTPPVVSPTSGNVGQLLTVTPGSWTGADTVTRQWRRNGVNIPGETGLTHTANLAGTFDCVETATNAGGSATSTSNASVITLPGAPEIVTPPVVSPTSGNVGQLLTVTPGSWTGADTVTRQWRRNGVNIPGETGLTHTASLTGTFDCVETATNAGGSATSSSNASVITDAPTEETVMGSILGSQIDFGTVTALPIGVMEANFSVNCRLYLGVGTERGYFIHGAQSWTGAGFAATNLRLTYRSGGDGILRFSYRSAGGVRVDLNLFGVTVAEGTWLNLSIVGTPSGVTMTLEGFPEISEPTPADFLESGLDFKIFDFDDASYGREGHQLRDFVVTYGGVTFIDVPPLVTDRTDLTVVNPGFLGDGLAIAGTTWQDPL